MGFEGFRDRTRFLLLLRLDFLEERDEGLRIVSSLVHILHPEIISLSFKASRELQKSQRNSETGAFIGCVADRTTHKNERNSHHLHEVGAGVFASGVAGGDVTNFVRHDSGELGFLVSSEDQARIHVKEATWQSEGVDVVRVNNLDRKRHLRIGITNYVLSQA